MTTQQILQGVHDWTNGKIVYDISVAHPDGQGNPTKYADLTAALGTGGANIPEALRKGGMSVKFVSSSDNKYVQYRYMGTETTGTPNPFLDTDNWQGVDDEPTAGSENLIKSGGVYDSTPTVTNSTVESSLDISDEMGNVLVRCSNGHLQVKNFSSSDVLSSIQAILSNIGFYDIPEFDDEENYAVGDIVRYEKYVYVFTINHIAGEWDETEVEKTYISDNNIKVCGNENESDFDISDEKGNVLVRFAGGHIQTKNFDSGAEIRPTKTNLYILSDGYITGNWEFNNDKYTSVGTGFNNRLSVDREFSLSPTKYIYDFQGNGVICVGVSHNTANNVFGDIAITAMAEVDTINKTFALKTNTQTIDTTSFNMDVTHGFRVIALWDNVNVVIQLYDLLVNEKVAEIASTNWVTSRVFWWEKPFIYAESGIAILRNIVVNCKAIQSRPLLYIVGDSITEGDKVPDENDRWTELLKNKLSPNEVLVSGRCSGRMQHVAQRLHSEAKQLRPYYVMFTIGANGGNTLSGLVDIIKTIQSIGAIPIACHTPSSGNSVSINMVIDQAITQSNIPCRVVYFDVATSLNYDIEQGQDSSLFADGLHPNALGCEKMYQRVMIDVPELLNFN